jgi:HK97 family phage portal protein
MRLFGLTIGRTKSLMPVASQVSSWMTIIREAFTGAWQQGVVKESKENLLAFSAVYACVALIADDISKLRIKLLRYTMDIWLEADVGSPFWPVLRKPNQYQTRIQFLSYWITCKLLYGNVFILKERDLRGVVVALHILDPRLVVVLVTEEGDVYYQLNRDMLALITISVTVPASEIIHDRMLTLWHPLIGVSPIVACGTSATQGLKIQANSAKFFENMSRPSGQLTAPGAISDENAKRLKEEFEKNFSGANIGRLLVTGDGLKYEPMSMPPEAAQLIEQLKWTVEDVARCFKVPQYKLGLAQPTLTNVAALNQDYYTQTLQNLIEAIELLLNEGLSLPADLGTELDLEGLLRMDPLSRAERYAKLVGVIAPNEAREGENLPPVEGGDTPYLQQQNYSLGALARRDAQADPFASAKLPAPAAPMLPAPVKAQVESDEEEETDFARALIGKIQEATYAEV